MGLTSLFMANPPPMVYIAYNGLSALVNLKAGKMTDLVKKFETLEHTKDWSGTISQLLMMGVTLLKALEGR